MRWQHTLFSSCCTYISAQQSSSLPLPLTTKRPRTHTSNTPKEVLGLGFGNVVSRGSSRSRVEIIRIIRIGSIGFFWNRWLILLLGTAYGRSGVWTTFVIRRYSNDRGVKSGSNIQSNLKIGRRVLAFVQNWSAGCEHEERGACEDRREFHGW